MIRISPSILSADFSRLEQEVADVEASGAHMLHIDVMDGHFVPNISFGSCVISSLRPRTKLFFDVHLMISDPRTYALSFAKAGAEIITVHTESDCDLGECIAKIKACGKKPGLVINPDTPIDAVLPYLEELYMVLVMTVQPGFGGQKCREDCFEKVRALRKIITERGLSVHIEVDGGITAENAPKAIAAGADVLVAGSSVFGAPDRNAAIDALRGI